MKHTPQKKYLRTGLGKSIHLFLVIAACSTYKTYEHNSGTHARADDPGRPKVKAPPPPVPPADYPEKQLYGQPYYLPKGLIHLVIKPESAPASADASKGGAGGGGGGGGSTAGTINIYNGVQSGTLADGSAAPAAPANPQEEKGTGGAGGKDAGGKSAAAPKDTSDKGDNGLAPVAYQITVERIMVPDLSVGPFIAHYEQNWLYAENTTLGVTADGLLSTANSTSTDQTAKIISNVVQTGINFAEFAAQVPSMGMAESVAKAPKAQGLKYIRYKRLNIDVTFDPLDAEQVRNVRKLFNPYTMYDPLIAKSTKEYVPGEYDFSTLPDARQFDDNGGQTYYVSPFDFDVLVSTPKYGAASAASNPAAPLDSKDVAPPSAKNAPAQRVGGDVRKLVKADDNPDYTNATVANHDGLLFRMPMAVQVRLTQNSIHFRNQAIDVLQYDNAVLSLFQTSDTGTKAFKDQITSDQDQKSRLQAQFKVVDSMVPANEDAKAKKAQDEGTINDKIAALDKDIAANNQKINDARPTTSGAQVITGSLDDAQSAVNDLRKILFALPTISRTTLFVKSIPDPRRVMTFNISRSAFVSNKVTSLTISDGMLTQVNINKPSEIEGFTEIPLQISEELLKLPSGLLTLRTQNLNNQTSLLGAQTNLVNAQNAQQTQVNAAAMNAQAAQLNAQTALLKAQADLINQQSALLKAKSGQ